MKGALAGAEPDFYTFHYYGGSAEQVYWALQQAQSIVAPVPLLFGETGYPTSTQVTGYSDLPVDAASAGSRTGAFPEDGRLRRLEARAAAARRLDARRLRARQHPARRPGSHEPGRIPLRALPDRREPEARRGRRALHVRAGAADGIQPGLRAGSPCPERRLAPRRVVGVRQPEREPRPGERAAAERQRRRRRALARRPCRRHLLHRADREHTAARSFRCDGDRLGSRAEPRCAGTPRARSGSTAQKQSSRPRSRSGLPRGPAGSS